MLGQWCVTFWVIKASGLTTVSNTACSPNTVHILINSLRKIIVHNMGDIFNVWNENRVWSQIQEYKLNARMVKNSFKAMFISTTEIQFYRVLKMVYDILTYSYSGLLPSSTTGKRSLLQHKGHLKTKKTLLGPQTSKSHF